MNKMKWAVLLLLWAVCVLFHLGDLVVPFLTAADSCWTATSCLQLYRKFINVKLNLMGALFSNNGCKLWWLGFTYTHRYEFLKTYIYDVYNIVQHALFRCRKLQDLSVVYLLDVQNLKFFLLLVIKITKCIYFLWVHLRKLQGLYFFYQSLKITKCKSSFIFIRKITKPICVSTYIHTK